MERQVMFKAKRLEIVTLEPTNEWVYGYLMRGANDGEFMIQEESKLCHLVDGNTIGEFTGLVDWNGTPVFEDDIVRLYDERIGYDVLAVIEFGEDVNFHRTWGWHLKPLSKLSGVNSWVSLEILQWLCVDKWSAVNKRVFVRVVGNIHDNPELLEVKEN